jgi:hypothetical protein
MKKPTIKRRMRVVSATQDVEMKNAANSPEPRKIERRLKRGTENDDGSINLGAQRRTAQHLSTAESKPATVRTSCQAFPLAATLDFITCQERRKYSQRIPSHTNADSGVSPISSMADISSQQRSMSLPSFLSPKRKRPSSATDTGGGSNTNLGQESSKRISSIMSILTMSTGGGGRSGSTDMSEYILPPIRSAGEFLSPPVKDIRPGAGTKDTERQMDRIESDRLKAAQRLALRSEMERINEMLAAKERELLELGNS